MADKSILVTGGGGFLGKAIIHLLKKDGYKLRSYSRGRYPELEKLGVETFQGNISDEAALEAAAQGCHAIMHVAAKAGVYGPYEEYYEANVRGTSNVIAVCHKLGIQRLIYTSTPSVTFDGGDQEGVDESSPYTQRFYNAYQRTKTIAETMVLKANSEKLATVALRPHLIWGPGDTQLVPRIIDKGLKKQIKIIGKKPKIIDAVYIDNAAYAHQLALEKLDPRSTISGQAYFITNHEPWPLENVIGEILACAGISGPTKHIPESIAYAAGAILENTYKLLQKTKEPPMTRFVARQLATSHWYDPKKATTELGYEPKISMSEGFARLRSNMTHDLKS